MTMANSAVSSAPRNGVSLRKTNKPLMEKRRRARINDSLTQLKSLVIHSSKKDSSQFSKLEKADILELTVKHLRGLQQQQHQQQQQQVNPTDASANSNNKYQAGFMECANEVIRYLDQSQTFSNDTKAKVISHLAQCLQLVSHVQSKSLPAPAATILNAPPATTATTQLPNGQIIQIVSNPIQNIQPATAAGILGFKQPVSSIQGFNVTPGMTSTSATASTTGTAHPANPAPSQTAYVRYTQPLHIQIPPLVSPVLIQQTQPAKMAAVAKETNCSSNSASRDNNGAQDVVSSSTSLASPLPTASSTSSSPSSHSSSLLKVKGQKQLNFYSPEEANMDMFARSRTYSMTSSSSSSETEMTSPLNLSQSPPFPSLSHKLESTRLPHPHRHHHHRSTSSSSTSSSTSTHSSSILPEHYQASQPIPIKAHDDKSSSSVSLHQHHHLNGQSSFQERVSALNLNATSVIVNSRKFTATEFLESKYLTMMESHDERHCINHHSTPSPASSMGEDRLWRPW